MAVGKSITLPLGFPENGRSVTFWMTEGEDSARLNVGKLWGLACSAPGLPSEFCFESGTQGHAEDKETAQRETEPTNSWWPHRDSGPLLTRL